MPDPTPEALRLVAAVNSIIDSHVDWVLAGPVNRNKPATASVIARALDDAGLRELVEENRRLREAQKVVNDQANDESLWFDAEYITEAMLQKELRRLHEVIEGVSQLDAARAALRKGEPSEPL